MLPSHRDGALIYYFISYFSFTTGLCYDNTFFFPIPDSTCWRSNTEVDSDVLSPSGQTIVAHLEAVKFIASNFLPRAGFEPTIPIL